MNAGMTQILSSEEEKSFTISDSGDSAEWKDFMGSRRRRRGHLWQLPVQGHPSYLLGFVDVSRFRTLYPVLSLSD